MLPKAKTQRDYLLTEWSVELPSNVSQVDEVLRAMGTTGKMVVLYNKGHIGGINVEQKTKVPESKSGDVRELLGVSDKEL